MLATENRTRSRIKRILAIALPVVRRQIRTIRVHGAILVALLGLVVSGFSQTTISTGGIQGTVTDQSGALVTGAIVSITNTATGQTASVNTNSAGAYMFAFLKPADYVLRIEARSFKTTRLPITDRQALQPSELRPRILLRRIPSNFLSVRTLPPHRERLVFLT